MISSHQNENYNPYSISFVKNILKVNNLKLSKSRGQNFLIDLNISKKIISHIPKDAVIFEVGSGLGALTYLLIENFKVYSIEIDKGIYNLLKQFLSSNNLVLIHGDFLSINIDVLKEEKLFFVSNLPYSISGEAIKIFIDTEKFSQGIVMLQKDFIDRMLAKPGNSNYSILSIISQYYLEIEYLFDVSKNCFFPIPEVESGVIYLKKKIRNISQKEFKIFLQKFFSSKRKKISHIFKIHNISLDILNKLNIDPDSRSEDVSVSQWESLYFLVYGIKN